MENFVNQPLSPLVMTPPAKTLQQMLQSKQAEAPCIMTDHELLISLHQKVDRNHNWVKRQLAAILANMTMA
jgi:hypothetical protein